MLFIFFIGFAAYLLSISLGGVIIGIILNYECNLFNVFVFAPIVGFLAFIALFLICMPLGYLITNIGGLL